MPARPGERLAAGAARDGELVDLGEHASGGGAGEVRAARRGGRGGERGRVLRAGGQLGAGHVVGGLDGQAAGLEHVAAAGGGGPRRAWPPRPRRRARSPRARERVRRAWRRRGRARARPRRRAGRGAERRHEALRRDQHRASGRPCARRSRRRRRAGRRTARRARTRSTPGELDLAHGLDVDGAVELDARAGSARSRAPAAERLGLRGGAAAELHLEPGAREHDGGGGAHRAGAHHGGRAQRRQAAEPLPLELDARPDPLGHLAGEERRRRPPRAGR